MKRFFKHGISVLLTILVAFSAMLGYVTNVSAESKLCPICGKDTIEQMSAKKPLFTENGWEAYEVCTREDCSYTTFKGIPALGEPEINDYYSFIQNLAILEGLANNYVLQNPGNDPLELVIKYIRTGVDRYNSGSWGIMAGYENKEFADFVRRMENSVNYETENVEDYLKVTSLKNINNFYLPNGDRADLGHMFGTMDIAYTNKGSLDHADVGGWAGDLVDLITSADADQVSGTVEEMVAVLEKDYFLKNPQPSDVFSLTDFYGDLDAYYIFNTVSGRKYGVDDETGIGTLTEVIMEYFTEDLSQEDRAEYFLKNRLGNAGTREQVRRAVYNAYTGNKTVSTLEATRPFLTNQENINNLRKASCYVFADYICKLAGDYVEVEDNPYYSDFNVESSTLAPGIAHETHYATTQDGKQIVYYVATADLSNENVTVNSNYNNNDPTQWKMSRVLDQANAAQAKFGDPESENYIENYQIVAAINADGYDMKTGKPGGLFIMNGIEYNGINSAGFFGITKEGKAVIGTTDEYNTIYKDKLRDAVGAFGVTLVKDGKIAVSKNSNYYADRASRTAVGITRTGKVVFMVLDGRQEPRSCGGSMEEIAQIMLEAGCYTAVNLDGGGSTTFVSKPEGEEELKVTSNPSDGYARSVSTSLIMVSTAPSSTKFDHARLDSDYSYATVNTQVKITPVGLSATGNVVDIPENCEWKIATNSNYATITEDGVFVGTRNRTFEIELICDGEVIGQKTIEVVEPNNVYFERKTLDAVYGSEVNIPVAAVYNGNAVAINESDIVLTVQPATAGTIEGYKLIVAENPSVKNVTITATLKNDESVTSTMSINLYNQGENTFDFEKATGGDRQFAWDRKVSNSTSDDAVSYIAQNPDEDMVTSYIFAIDMQEIPIPTQLTDLTYMLPGADDIEASAWNFLLQLAERVSVLTEVKPVLKFDERFEIDYSEMEVINEYFYLDSKELDEEKNELTLTLKWHDQTSSIKPETANPLCILRGIKLIPKEGAFEGDKLNAVHIGEIGYKIYLRANALYTFSAKPENQAIYGLYPFENTFIDANGEEQDERGGYFKDVYTTFEDRYTLSLVKKNGWINEEGGFAYYIEGEKLTGVQLADGYYYDFGVNGINVGQTKYTGFFEREDKTYYVRLGELIKSKWQLVGDEMYHCHADGDAYITSVNDPVTCVKGGNRTYKCTECNNIHMSSLVFPEGHDWDSDYKCHICGTVGKDISTGIIRFGTIENPRTSTSVARYEQTSAGVRPSTHITFDEKTALSWSNDAKLNSDNTMRDLYVSWTNDRGIGKAYVNFTGKGNYYGEGTLEYIILPANVKNFKAEAGIDSVTLTWDKAPGAGYYRLYKGANGGDWNEITTTGTTYTITGLDAETEYTFSIATSATSTDGENKKYNCSEWANVTVTTKELPTTSGMISDIKAVVGENECVMLKKDNMNYIMLPAHSELDELTLSFVATGDVSGKELSISGNSGSTSSVLAEGKNTLTVNINNIATMTENKYSVNLAVGSSVVMEIAIMQGSQIPSMFITSDDLSKDREYIDSSKSNKATGNMFLTDNSGNPIYNGKLTEIKARGNSTFAHYDKKAYQIKLETKTDLVGNGEKIKTWVLLANYGDATLMHDKFMKDLAQEMGIKYTADSDWVNLWYDGEYRGTYLISEKNSVGSTSVDIADMEEGYEELNSGYGENATIVTGTNSYGQEFQYTTGLTDPEDITGGYLIELNHNYIDEANGFKTKKGVAFNIKSPEWLSENAVKYISEYYQEFEDAVYAVKDGVYTGYNEETGKYFYEYVDIDSLVKIFAIQEIGLNPDGFISSLYFNKDANGIMYVGPVWDQDMTLGTGWNIYIPSNVQDYHYLAKALINIPIFKAKLANFFEDEAVAMIEEATKSGGTIDKNYDKLSQSAEMNYTLWPYVRIGNPQKSGHIWEDANYDLVVDDMKSWLDSRLEILKERFIVDVEHKHICNSWTADGDENHTGICLCGDVATEPHTWDAGVVTKEATESEDGEKLYTCTVCNHTKEEVLPALGHTHVMNKVDADEPTCIEDGNIEYYYCSGCGLKFTSEDATEEVQNVIIPAAGHSHGDWEADGDENHKKECECSDVVTEPHAWDEGEVTKEATETEIGEKTYTCTVCGHTKTEDIPATGGSTTGGSTTGGSTTGGSTTGGSTTGGSTTGGSTTGGSTTGGSTTGGSTTGGSTTEDPCANGHSWNTGVVTKQPTTTATGIKTYTCTVCEETKTETIPKLSGGSSGGGGSSDDVEVKYTVKFNSNGGSTVKSVTVKKNDVVTEPTAPTKAGFKFEGWYTDSKLTKKYNFSAKVTKDITLYAKWTEIPKTEDPKVEEPADATTFTDVKASDWFASAVEYAAKNKLMAGVSETEFAPNVNTTRAMIVTVLYRLEGQSAKDGVKPFDDVDMDAYYADAVIWAKQNGIVYGFTETEFGPDVVITREQLAAIMHRYAEFKGYDTTQGGMIIREFSDYENISDFALNSMTWAVNTELLKGRGNNNLAPKDNATRAEFASIMQRFIEANK